MPRRLDPSQSPPSQSPSDDQTGSAQQSDQSKNVPFFWARDASGHKSVSVTLLVVSFFVTTIAFILSIFQKIGPLEIRQFDVAACSSYFVPVLTLYFSRRWTDAKMGITQARDAANFANTPVTEPLYSNQYSNQYQYPGQSYPGPMYVGPGPLGARFPHKDRK